MKTKRQEGKEEGKPIQHHYPPSRTDSTRRRFGGKHSLTDVTQQDKNGQQETENKKIKKQLISQQKQQQSKFTLITPNLKQKQHHHQTNQQQQQQTNQQQQQQPYDSFTSSDINFTLQSLIEFWNNILQEHSLTADLGIQLNHQHLPTKNNTSQYPVIQSIRKSNSFKQKSPPNHEKPPTETDLTEIPSHLNESEPRQKPSIVSGEPSKPPTNHKPIFKQDGIRFLNEKPSPTYLQHFPFSRSTSANNTIPTRLATQAGTPKSPPNAPTRSYPQPSAWWLDITCPTSEDMDQLGKIFPLHPLTVEDILQQDTREKTETFHRLGYYLVCFRGLDPSNFNYKQHVEDDDANNHYNDDEIDKEPNSTTTNHDILTNDADMGQATAGDISGRNKIRTVNSSKLEIKSTTLNNHGRTKRDGLATPTGNNDNRKTYIFPTLENQSNQTDLRKDSSLHDSKDQHGRSDSQPDQSPKLPDPATDSDSAEKQNYLNRHDLGVVNMYLVVFKDGIISFHFENVQKHIDHVKDRIQTLSSDTGHVSPHWIAYGLMDSIVDEFFPVLELIEEETEELEEYLLDPLGTTSAAGRHQKNKRTKWWKKVKRKTELNNKRQNNQLIIKQRMKPEIMMNKNYNYKLKCMTMTMMDRSTLLNKITFNRRLVVSMARLIVQKFQTVHALRKRMIDDQVAHGNNHHADPFADHQSKEIAFYLSDLQDHILSLTQSLNFYDSILSNAHSTYLGLLRVGLNSTKQEQDVMIMRLYLITLIVLPMNMLTGMHSMNIRIPSNGDPENHRRADGSRAPYTVFFIVLSACFLSGFLFVLFIWKVIINHSQVKFNRSFPKLFYFI